MLTLSESPTVNAAVMIMVLTMRPKTISSVCERRRGMLRSPSLNSTGLRSAAQARASSEMATIATRTTAIVVIGMPNRLFTVRPLESCAAPSGGARLLFADDQAVLHMDDAMAAATDSRVVRDDEKGLALLGVELLHQRHHVVG